MTDLLAAMANQVRDARERERGRTSRGLLMRAYERDCEHAALIQGKGMYSKARVLLMNGREHTIKQMEKRFGQALVRSHSRLINAALMRAQERAGL